MKLMIKAFDTKSKMFVELVKADFGKQLFTYLPVGTNPDVANVLSPVSADMLKDIQVVIQGQQCPVCGERAMVKIINGEIYEVVMMLNENHDLFLHEKCFFHLINVGNEMIKQWGEEKSNGVTKG